MGKAFSVEVTIAKPVKAVWATMTDWNNAHQWMPGVDSIKAHGETAPGTKLTFRARGKDRPSEIVECEPGRYVMLRSKQGGVTADYRYELHPLGEQTRVTLVAVCMTNGLFWGMMSPFIRLAMKLTDRSQLKELKLVMEGE